MTVARQICILENGVSLSCKRGLKRTQTKTGGLRGGGGEKIHANVNAAKRELRNALFSSQKRKVFISSFLKGLVVDIDCSVRKESLFESSWKSELWKREVVVFSCSSNRKSETHRACCSSGSKIFWNVTKTQPREKEGSF